MSTHSTSDSYNCLCGRKGDYNPVRGGTMGGMPRLHRVNCSRPGIQRRRQGRGFVYVDECGDRINDADTLDRIRNLAIPPAWSDVWICPSSFGHIQALGTDAAGRRQYLYHQRWRDRRDQKKFDHMIEFARSLPQLREYAGRDLALPDLSKPRVLACAIRLLDKGFFRIGGEDYAEQNQTFGLATIQRRHVRLGSDNEITFDYTAKSGKRRVETVVDRDAFAVVAALKKRRNGGPNLLAYKALGKWVQVRSIEINEYIKQATGGDFTAKDFRTWSATVLAAVGLAVSSQAHSEAARKRAISRAIQEVSHYLGNTPAVCRSSYIDPRVFDRYRQGLTIGGALESLGDVDVLGEPAFQGAVELAVLDLLERHDSPAIEKIA